MTEKEAIINTALKLCSMIVRKIESDQGELEEDDQEKQMLNKLCLQCTKAILFYQSEKLYQEQRKEQ